MSRPLKPPKAISAFSIYPMLCFIKCSTISLSVAKHIKDTTAQSPSKAIAEIYDHLKLTGIQ